MRVPTWLRIAIIVVAVFLVAKMISREGFMVPVFPTKYADQRMTTPAGNRITY